MLQSRSYRLGVAVTDGAPTGRRDRKKRQTRAALVAAALRLVAERGLDQVTVEEISEAADVSARTFFNYFASKDDALIGDHAVDGGCILGRLAAAPPQLSAVAAVRFSLVEAIEEMQAEAELWFLRMDVVAQNPVLLPRLLASNAEREREMVGCLAARVGVPTDHGFPALVTAVTGAAFRTAMIRWAESGGARPLAGLVDEAFDALTAGLPDPAPDRAP